MSQHRVRIVVGEGRSARMGFLRFVLQSEGYEVVEQASSAAELARVLAEHQPDVVVLDDGIGATAVQMAHEVSPSSKVILVWPGAVVPIGGDARVEPGDVLRSLGPAVAKAIGPLSASLETISKPAWIDRMRKDPATLRERLDQHGGLPDDRPSVTELQRQVHFDDEPDEEVVADEPLAPVLPLSRLSLPPAVWASTIDLDEVDEGVGAATAVATGAESTEWNRRLGMIALGGAVAASAVVVALALTPGSQGILSAVGFFPPAPVVTPAPGATLAGAYGQGGVVTGLDGLLPSAPSNPAGGIGGPHGGGNTGGGNTGGGNTGGGSTGGGNTGGGSTGGGGGIRTFGNSALHNPFGGPPGQAHHAPSASPGNSAAAHDHAAQRGNSGTHASQNGQDHRHNK